MVGLCTLLFLIDYRLFPHYDFSFTPFFCFLFFHVGERTVIG